MIYYYLIIFFILTFCAILEMRGLNSYSTKIVRFVVFFLVFATSAFKYETGVDWRVYEYMTSIQWPLFDIFSEGWSNFFGQIKFEPGYIFFTATIKQFGGGIQCVFFFAALINIILLYKSLVYFSKYPIFSLLGYYCFVFFILDMSGIRQAIALNIILYAMRFACERKIWKYFLGVFIAALFHQTAYLLIIVYPLFYKSRINLSVLIGAYGLSLVILFLKVRWLEGGTTILLSILGMNGTLNEKLVLYVLSSNYNDEHLNIIKVIFTMIVILYILYYQRIILNTPLNKFSFLCVVIFAILNNIMFELAEINARISVYLIIFLSIITANMVWCSKIQYNRIILNGIFIFYCFLYASAYLLERPGAIAYYPYQNYLIYELFEIRSTGEKRLDDFANSTGR